MKRGPGQRGEPSTARRLTPQQALFVEHYIACMNGAEAARRAGYKPENAKYVASRLLDAPKVRQAIDERFGALVSRLHITQEHIILRLFELAQANLGDYLEIHGSSILVKKDIPLEKLALVKSIQEMERGGVRLELHDKLQIFDRLARHLGMYERARQARRAPDAVVCDILAALAAKDITPAEAAIRCDQAGVPIPESVRLILSRTEPETQNDDDGAYAVISPEEMAARAKERRAVVERQETEFVQARSAEIDALKREMGGGAFQAQAEKDEE